MASSAALLASLLVPVKAPARALGTHDTPLTPSSSERSGTLTGTALRGQGEDPAGQRKEGPLELYSNHTGEFAQRVPAGKADYIVWADVKGYNLPSGQKLKPGSEVTAHIDSDERCDIGLHLDW